MDILRYQVSGGILQKPTSSPPLVSYHGGHTIYDGTGTPEEFVERALKLGFISLGFSEHMPAPKEYTYPDFPDFDQAHRLFDGYVETVLDLKDRYRDDLPILLGVETEYFREEKEYLSDFLERYPFDYVLGSVHYVKGHGFDFSEDVWKQAADACGGPEGLAVEYYSLLRELMAMGVVDVLGHIDIIDIFASGSLTGPVVEEAEQHTLEAARDADIVVEINARGLIKACRHAYPRPDLLRRACEAGVSITLGDDSHAPDQVGARFDIAFEEIRRAGFTEYVKLTGERRNLQREAIPV